MRKLLVCAVLATVGCAGEVEKKEQGKAAPEEVVKCGGENNIHNEYRENPAAADLKYKGKLVELGLVRGQVSQDEFGKNFVFAPVGVACYVKDSSLPKLATAKPGQAFKLRGVCQGRRGDGGPDAVFIVLLNDCEILSVLEHRKAKWVEAD